MALCICDGPPHPYDPSWCRQGRSADPPHGPIANPTVVIVWQTDYPRRGGRC